MIFKSGFCRCFIKIWVQYEKLQEVKKLVNKRRRARKKSCHLVMISLVFYHLLFTSMHDNFFSSSLLLTSHSKIPLVWEGNPNYIQSSQPFPFEKSQAISNHHALTRKETTLPSCQETTTKRIYRTPLAFHITSSSSFFSL